MRSINIENDSCKRIHAFIGHFMLKINSRLSSRGENRDRNDVHDHTTLIQSFFPLAHFRFSHESQGE